MMISQVLRSVSVRLCVLGGVMLGVSPAIAEPLATPPPGANVVDGVPGRRVVVVTPPSDYATPGIAVSPTIFLQRCKGGCTIHMGPNDARVDSSTIPAKAVSTISEFQNSDQQTGAAADAEWNAVVQCLKEVYSPFAANVTDVRPAPGPSYHMAIIAGFPGDAGLSSNILGVAPLARDCSAIDNVVSFSFANAHPPDAPDNNRVHNLCWTAAQEIAHAFGLDHEFSFANNRSACNDPMTYRFDCGGQKFFRNEDANCGETSPRPCQCGAVQNSHAKLSAVFGPGTPITGNPTSVVTSPVGGAMTGQVVTVKAGSKRGITRVELLFNGFKWADIPGLKFGPDGQPNPGDYNILIPATLPNSIVDITAKAYDDLGAVTESAVITATRGAACQAASTCATGQKCEAGKCFWDPPAGELGDDCSYPQFCKSGLCRGTQDQQICTHNCLPFMADSCEAGFECILDTPDNGICFLPESGGCCSVERGGRSWLAQVVLAALVLGFVVRRRRR